MICILAQQTAFSGLLLQVKKMKLLSRDCHLLGTDSSEAHLQARGGVSSNGMGWL